MSFQFSPKTLILEIERQIVQLEGFIRRDNIVLAQREAFCPTVGGFDQRADCFKQTDNLKKKIQSFVNRIAIFKNRIQILQDEADLRAEGFQPIDITLDADVMPITTEQKKIDLKNIAIIGGAILLLS